MMKILVLSPHTDDAELGCGGTISKFIEENHEIFSVAFSTAEESLPQDLPKDTLEKEFLNVIADLGLKKENYQIFNYRVRNLHEHRHEILEESIKLRDEVKPNLTIIPSLNDYHQDHQVVSREAVRAFKRHSSILGYELPWNHISFDTVLFSKLKRVHVIKKHEMLQNYKSQIIKNPHYFSKEYVFGLAKVRGLQCNSDYAEAFEVIRWMI